MNYIKKFSKTNNTVFHSENGEQGSSLIVVLVMMATMVAIAFGAIQVTQLNVSSSGAHKIGKQTFYSAEYGLDFAVNEIVQKFENLSIYTTSAEANTADPGNPNITEDYKGYDVTYSVTNPLDRFLYRTIVGNGTIFHYAYTFDIQSTAVSQTDNSTQTLNETIRILETPLVQYFAFYAGSGDLADLELYPGADMNIWGRMHANRNMHITARNGNNREIVIRNWDFNGNASPHFVTMAGEFRGTEKHSGNSWANTGTYLRYNNSGGTPAFNNAGHFRQIPNPVDSGNETEMEGCVPADNGFCGYLLVNERTYQAPDQTQFWRNGFYEGRSENPQNPRIDSMKILVDEDNPCTIRVWVSRPSLTEVTTEIINGGAARFHSDNTVFMAEQPIEDTSGTNTMWDGREQRWVDFTDIDLNLVGAWYLDYLNAEGLSWAGDGMLIYASRSGDGTGTDPVPFLNADPNRIEAFRLKEHPGSQPMVRVNTTFATDNPIYIQGDFNTNTTVGVALVSDATNILSNDFTTKGQANVNGNYEASTTTVNAAFFSGIIPNVAGSNNRVGGGLHNYARLHEDWLVGGDVPLNINGSFISLWQSSQATGTWCHGNNTECYVRPARNFGWDVRFEEPTFWPPFIPSIFSVERAGFLDG